MLTGSLCPHCRPSWKCFLRRSRLVMLLRHPPLHFLRLRVCHHRSLRPRHLGRSPISGARTRTHHRGRCTLHLRPFRARIPSWPLRTLSYLLSQAGLYLLYSTPFRGITRRLPSSLSRLRLSTGMQKRNLSALVTDPRRHHTHFPVCVQKLEDSLLGNCRHLPIPFPREIAPVPGFPRRMKHGGRRLDMERKPIIHLTVHPTTRRLSTSTSKQAAGFGSELRKRHAWAVN